VARRRRVGAAAVAFAKCRFLRQLGLRRPARHFDRHPWFLAPLGFCHHRLAHAALLQGRRGSGIPQTIFAIRADSGELGERFLRPAVVIGRVVFAGAALLCAVRSA